MKFRIPQKTVLITTVVLLIVGWTITLVNAFQHIDDTLNMDVSVPMMLRSVLIQLTVGIGLVSLLLWLGNEKYADLGFHRNELARQVAIGVGLGVSIFFLSHAIVKPVLGAFLPSDLPEGIEKSGLFDDIRMLPVWVFVAIAGGGFLEELRRIFTLTRFEKLFGRTGLIVSLLITSLVFGVNHLYQGIDSAIGTGIDGFLYGLVYLRKRSAVEAMSCHAGFDLLGIAIGYSIYLGQ